ncbi:glutathione peroxidase [Streptococcus pseudoporcinus]|uniref:Glutathione peroxidase n=1 Tax=Streptococcus pseudoporcinus TaxID=361101 RepID=A0A4U9XH88_9STRE|nr:glutathione peroxidase [Streptococcus pseudoporcinus]VTS12440.1 glutathione peroxidase [Streptococcus pseudoporcinus]VUC64967.1 glutathione peroxidase [Streptococcus pseudoporcinus]VUC95600.1 glutathione peroxidase [Streptococcus pseudoporcinus]VUC95996.1 glutathione peroxidase [Streptococcus pseudoporcinus]
MKSIFDFTVKNKDGVDVSLSEYKGKVLLIVNTATKCGFTSQYDPLEAMYKDLKEKGLEILDFPCDQFSNQAPGSDEEIDQFCTLHFGTEFPRFAKIDVNGENADPLFVYLGQEKPFEGFGKSLVTKAVLGSAAKVNNKKFGEKTYVGWNFTKFLVNRKGQVIARFEPTEDMKNVRSAVEAAL